jgi:hypothetical protein
VGQKASFQLAFVEGLFQGQEVEKVGIFQQAGGEVRVNLRQGGGEIGDGRALALVGALFDLGGECFAAPSGTFSVSRRLASGTGWPLRLPLVPSTTLTLPYSDCL